MARTCSKLEICWNFGSGSSCGQVLEPDYHTTSISTSHYQTKTTPHELTSTSRGKMGGKRNMMFNKSDRQGTGRFSLSASPRPSASSSPAVAFALGVAIHFFAVHSAPACHASCAGFSRYRQQFASAGHIHGMPSNLFLGSTTHSQTPCNGQHAADLEPVATERKNPQRPQTNRGGKRTPKAG